MEVGGHHISKDICLVNSFYVVVVYHVSNVAIKLELLKNSFVYGKEKKLTA